MRDHPGKWNDTNKKLTKKKNKMKQNTGKLLVPVASQGGVGQGGDRMAKQLPIWFARPVGLPQDHVLSRMTLPLRQQDPRSGPLNKQRSTGQQ